MLIFNAVKVQPFVENPSLASGGEPKCSGKRSSGRKRLGKLPPTMKLPPKKATWADGVDAILWLPTQQQVVLDSIVDIANTTNLYVLQKVFFFFAASIHFILDFINWMGAPMGFPRLHASSLSQASCFKCFVCLGCFRFLDCDFRPQPRRINGTHVTWSHGSSDAWSYQSHVSNPTRDDPLFFRMGRTNRFVFYAPVFNIVEPKKRREHPKLPWPMLSHGHASMLLVIYIHCFDLFCWCEKHCTTADERLQNMLRLPVCSQDSYCRCFLANYLPLKERTLTMELDNDRLRNAGKSWALSLLNHA